MIGKIIEQGEWSWELVYFTWNELNTYRLYRQYTDRNSYLKRKIKGKLQYGFIPSGNDPAIVKEGDLIVFDSNGEDEWKYESVDEIIADGWVVD